MPAQCQKTARWALFLRRFEFTLTYHPGSRYGKTDPLSRQFSPDLSDLGTGPILSPSCIEGAVTWEVEEKVYKALHTVPETPRLIVPALVRSEVLKWGHSSRPAYHTDLIRTLHLF